MYFGLWSFTTAVLLVWLMRYPLRTGRLFLIFLLFHETGKALLENLRLPSEPHLQIASASLATLAGLVLIGLNSVE